MFILSHAREVGSPVNPLTPYGPKSQKIAHGDLLMNLMNMNISDDQYMYKP